MINEFLNLNTWGQYLVQFALFILSTAFVFILGWFRKEWRSRKAILTWIWTMLAVNVMLMNGAMAESTVAMIIAGGAVLLLVVNFIGDRFEVIKFKEFEMRLNGLKPEIKKNKSNEGEE
jgi:biotin transporter BioY